MALAREELNDLRELTVLEIEDAIVSLEYFLGVDDDRGPCNPCPHARIAYRALVQLQNSMGLNDRLHKRLVQAEAHLPSRQPPQPNTLVERKGQEAHRGVKQHPLNPLLP